MKLMLIRVKVYPGSKKQGLIRKAEDSFEIKVKEKPIKGEANKAVINILALFFNISKGKIRLIKGFKERNKIFEIKSI